MDANGTRYHLLLTRSDWSRCSFDQQGDMRLGEAWSHQSPPARDADITWNSEFNELTLRPLVFQFVAAPRDIRPTLADRRGMGRDAYGNWYWIAENSQEILVRSSGTQRTTHYWSAEDESVCEPESDRGEFAPERPAPAPKAIRMSGLAVTEDQYLVVGVLEPPGLLIFDLYAGGAPRQIKFPEDVDFVPFDMAPRPKGGVWVLDQEHHRYWAFDRRFNVDPCQQEMSTLQAGGPEIFQPADPADERRERLPLIFPHGITLDAASPLDVTHPIAIEGMPDGTVLILDRERDVNYSTIHQYEWGRRIGEPMTTLEMLEHLENLLEASPFGSLPDVDRPCLLCGHDLAYVPLPTPIDDGTRHLIGKLYIASAEGNQSFVFDVFKVGSQLQLDALPYFLPMRLFGGKGIAAGGSEVYYDFSDRWLPLTVQRRPRYINEATLYTPIAAGQPVLDGQMPECVWHRVFLDACLPPGTEIIIASRAADDLEALREARWHTEAKPYRRAAGSELPFAPTQGLYETWELLFEKARGRYLQLALTLRGNGQGSPHLRAMRVYYPRFSYLTHYFPAVYQENEVSASFMDRFLANFEGLFTSMEDRIAAAQVLLDPRSAPPEALDWLVSWFGLALDPSWDETRRRLFIKYAMRFFEQRGTLNGLYMALQLAFDDCPSEQLFTTPLCGRTAITGIRIVETFRTRRVPALALGDPTEAAGPRPLALQERWSPTDGSARLQERYRQFIERNGITRTMPASFPITPPENAAVWQQFAQGVLGFIPSISATDAPRWRAFLARRYTTIGALNNRYGLAGSGSYNGFEAIDVPTTLPADGAPLQDWYQFQSVVLAMHRSAHHFVVLLPLPAGVHADSARQQEHLALARRVIDLEKPAHTTCSVKFYWAMFRVGEVRLGYDTLIGQGSRSPELMTPMILGQGYLAEGYLASRHARPEGRAYVSGDYQ